MIGTLEPHTTQLVNGEQPLDNVFRFIYLWTVFAAKGLQCYDVDARVAMSDGHVSLW